MDWNDPAARAAYAEQHGTVAYNEALRRHQEATTVATVNGHAIRPVSTRFGRLFLVDGTDHAFRTQAEAEDFARTA